MLAHYGASRYQQVVVTTASRGQILLLLYEAAALNLRRAAAAIERRDVAARGSAIGRVHDILAELLATLDHDAGGVIATDLARLYHFTIAELMRANLESSAERLQSVRQVLEILLEGWRGAVAQTNGGAPPL